jgi:uracil-DNA glycosylase family 4
VTQGEDDLEAALALLARGLTGAIDVAGLDYLPRPMFSLATGPQPATTTTTTTTTPMATGTSTAAPTPLSVAATTPRVSLSTLNAPPPATAMSSPSALAASPSVAAQLAEVVQRATPANERLRVLCDDVIGACTRCKLHRGRNALVFGAGDPSAELVFVGEGPGEDEDRQGVPFVGKAGQLLTKMITAMGRDRDRGVYICNVVKCRPPNNRTPEPDEVEACVGFLDAQLAIIRPRVIVGLGGTACQTLLRTTTPISKLRGQWRAYRGIPFMPTYHPSYLLREARDPLEARKREAWNDLKQVMARLQSA